MSLDDNQQNESGSVPNWVIYAGIGIASFIAYKTMFKESKFVHDYKYVIDSSDDYIPSYPQDDGDEKRTFSTNPFDAMHIYRSKKGSASRAPVTIFQMFSKCVNNEPTSIHWKKEYLNKETNIFEWRSWTRQEIFDLVQQCARAFIAAGLKRCEAVSIIGFNSPEWLIADLGAIYAGGIVAGIYATNKEEACRHIVTHSKSSIIVVENQNQLRKFVNLRNKKLLPLVELIIIWGCNEGDNLISEANNFSETNKHFAKILHWNEFMKLGNNKNSITRLDKEMKQRINTIEPGHCCTLIYTSGTTGLSKGVMISHDNITWQARSIISHVQSIKKDGTSHASVSYLPLSHIAAQLLDIYFPMAFGADYAQCKEWIMYFARADALKGTLNKTLKAARPTLFFGVPRVWEKIQEKIINKSRENPMSAPKKMLIDWLKGVVLNTFYNKQIDGNMIKPFGYSIAESLLINKVKKLIGFDRLQVAFTGAAPTPIAVLEFWASLGVNICEVYGMSESSGVHTCSLAYYNKIGTVGVPLSGVTTLIDHVDEKDKGDRHDKQGHGEICIRGRHVMMGYLYDDEKTKKVIDKFGYLHSGDIGTINDKYNILKITGRLKELLITHGGENIAPVPIEDYIKKECPAISNIIIIGDKKKYLTCLIALRCKLNNKNDGTFTNYLDGIALDIDSDCSTVGDARNSKKWLEYIMNGLNRYNNDKENCVSRAQTIKYYRIINGDFSIETGELTSTMKLKRAIISNKHNELVKSMYIGHIKNKISGYGF